MIIPQTNVTRIIYHSNPVQSLFDFSNKTERKILVCLIVHLVSNVVDYVIACVEMVCDVIVSVSQTQIT